MNASPILANGKLSNPSNKGVGITELVTTTLVVAIDKGSNKLKVAVTWKTSVTDAMTTSRNEFLSN